MNNIILFCEGLLIIISQIIFIVLIHKNIIPNDIKPVAIMSPFIIILGMLLCIIAIAFRKTPGNQGELTVLK